MIFNKNRIKVVLFYKDGSVETVERDTWLTLEELQVSFRRELEDVSTDDVLIEWFTMEDVTNGH